MFNQTTVFVLVSFLATLLLATSSATQYSELIDEQQLHELQVKTVQENNPFLIALGTVGSKTFFMDNSTKRTWDEAKTYATSMNMKLSEIMSTAEAQFIKDLPQTVFPEAYYWTGGRDSLLITQLMWDTNRTALNAFSPIEWVPSHIFRTCAALFPISGYTTNYYPRICTETSFALLQVP